MQTRYELEDDVLINVDNVSHVYDGSDPSDVGALRDVSLQIRRGEFVAIIGHNGSGKSTLAKHLNALLLPTAGRVTVEGLDTQDLEHVWTIRQMVGMVFQNPDNQIVATTVEEDVAFGPENLGWEPEVIAQRVREALRIVGLEGMGNKAPHQLSGGQKQRLAIAGILAMRPDVLVLDEPTAMLDPVGRAEVMRTVRRLNREEGITVVHITHFMDEAVYAHRVVVMESGAVALEGSPAEVFANVELLRRLDLDVPAVVELGVELRRQGISVPGDVLTSEEMVEFLCRLRSAT